MGRSFFLMLVFRKWPISAIRDLVRDRVFCDRDLGRVIVHRELHGPVMIDGSEFRDFSVVFDFSINYKISQESLCWVVSMSVFLGNCNSELGIHKTEF